MGVPHLEKLREYLQNNADQAFSRTALRDKLKQNFNTVEQNLTYLVDKEQSVQKLTNEKKELYQWKG